MHFFQFKPQLFSWKLYDFVKNTMLGGCVLFFEKPEKCFSGLISVTKFRHFPQKSRKFKEIPVKIKRTANKNQCERFLIFSCVFYFLKSDRYWKGFLDKRKKTSSKSMKKCVKLINIIKILAIWTLLERVMQARINLDGFLNFLYVFIK